MSKHTPGPWQYAFEGGTTAFITEADGSTIICIRTTENTTAHKNLAANARLIAAAPDLLEACKTFAEWLRREEMGFVAAGRSRDTPEGEAEWREWFYENLSLCQLAQDQARAAIAKATGESK